MQGSVCQIFAGLLPATGNNMKLTFTGDLPEWSDTEAPAVAVTGVYLYLPVIT